MFTILYLTILSFLASFAGTLSGFGMGTLMIPLVIFFMPFAQGLALVAMIHWFHNIWRIMLLRSAISRLSWMLFFYFGIPSVIAASIGAFLATRYNAQFLIVALSIFLMSYASLLFLRPSFKIKDTKATAALGGSVSGFFAGLLGVRGALKGAVVSSFDLQKGTYIVTMAMISMMVDTARVITYLYAGVKVPAYLLNGLIFFIPATLVGAIIAVRLVNVIPQERFRMVIAGFLCGIGVWLMVWKMVYS